MPPKGLKKLKRKTKKAAATQSTYSIVEPNVEMLVTSRLMAISLLVDDYIYKNKTISLLEAKTIDEEITLLKLKCKQDTRSLQVVEKLKKFMRSIIKEQSIDRIQEDLSSIVTEPCVINNTLKKLNVIPDDPENNISNNFITNTTTELFSTREIQNSEINNTTQDIKTQEKISTNITNPVIGIRNSEIIPGSIITANASTLKLNNTSGENNKNASKNVDIDIDNILSNPTNEKEQSKQDSVMLTSNLQKHTEQEKQNIQENQKSNDTNGTKNAEKQTKENKKTHTENKTIDKKNIKTKTKKVLRKELEKKSSGQSKKKPKEKSQIDFSWIENIKFVRDVSPDEHTEFQIENNFWSNLMLPGSWDPNDFD